MTISREEVVRAIPDALRVVDLEGFGPRVSGKVRESYDLGSRRILITTDRVSAFDRVLGAIPFKGQVLNQLSAWWFSQCEDIVANHLLETPHPNVTVARSAETLPVEVIVRGFITGVTSTALWTLYQQGERRPYGIELPDGLSKNDPLPRAIITPTTKATDGGHDERLTRGEILERRLVDPGLWAEVEAAALGLFARGQQLARKAGLILVDTKYEFGLVDGRLTLIDEIHTPDSSRYWLADSFGDDGEPANFDKEYLRHWFVNHGYRGEGVAPEMPDDLVVTVAARYIAAYERLTGQQFTPARQPVADYLDESLSSYRLQGDVK